ncbi:MAG: AAA domain-containing protein, partial [Chloroflexota bacterium]|nr:AAA domain-containing protein [Chloroflexota bacterium]
LYMLGSLVVGCEAGKPRPARRRSVVHLAEGPPDSAQAEQDLFVRWIEETTRAIVELAAPDEEGGRRAPIHLIFYSKWEQRLLLEGLGRHLNSVLGATPLYDFVTQLAAYDSPVATFLDEEIRELKNYPMVAQSLQAVAAFLKFDWNSPQPYRTLFNARMFDFWGKLEPEQQAVPGETPWYTNRARFSSQIPLEHAYAAWGELEKDGEEHSAYAATTPELLRSFHARRLEALEWVTQDFSGNKQTVKTPFDLPDLGSFEQKARTLADAIQEFVAIERHVELGDWKRVRLAPPERRLLSGDTLLVRYHEEEQEGDTAARNRENERRRQLRQQYEREFRDQNPEASRVTLTKEQKAETSWSPEGMRFRMRLDCSGADCDADAALRISTLREGSSVVIYPRTTVDTRLPAEERVPFTPTPKQMLRGPRGTIEKVDLQHGYVDLVMRSAYGSESPSGFAFRAHDRLLVPGELYTLDEDPNSWYGYWNAKVAEGLVAGGKNALYERVTAPASVRAEWPEAAAQGQGRFLEGLTALHEAGIMHGFEPSKHEYIGMHGDAPTLLVQGPPGTGKSYTTAYAVLARLQGAMAAGMEFRVLFSCKTHAATDVLLNTLVHVQEELRRLRLSHAEMFRRYFDPRLLDVVLYRVAGKAAPAGNVVPLPSDKEREPGQDRATERLKAQQWCVVASTPGGVYRMMHDRWPQKLFGHELFHCLVLDEASQMNLPEAVMAALPLASEGQLIVVGDHRQMPPIIKHDWIAEPRRTFQQYRSYESLFLTLRDLAPPPPMIRFEESFRLHAHMAEFLRREVYQQDGINYRSEREATLSPSKHPDPFVRSVLSPEQVMVVVVHDEAGSQLSNEFERELIRPVLESLADPYGYALDSEHGLGVVVPHRAQRAELQLAVPALVTRNPETGALLSSAVDTVERFQGGERRAIMVSATESDREYLLVSSKFLLDPRRLTVALSRAKEKMVLVASRSVFNLFSADEETFANAQIWKNLLRS